MDIFYFFVPYSNNDELWASFLGSLFLVCIAVGVLAALLFVFTRTGQPNLSKQNKYWWVIFAIALIALVITVLVIKGSVEDSSTKKFSFDLGGVITAIGGSCVYVLYFITCLPSYSVRCRAIIPKDFSHLS